MVRSIILNEEVIALMWLDSMQWRHVEDRAKRASPHYKGVGWLDKAGMQNAAMWQVGPMKMVMWH